MESFNFSMNNVTVYSDTVPKNAFPPIGNNRAFEFYTAGANIAFRNIDQLTSVGTKLYFIEHIDSVDVTNDSLIIWCGSTSELYPFILQEILAITSVNGTLWVLYQSSNSGGILVKFDHNANLVANLPVSLLPRCLGLLGQPIGNFYKLAANEHRVAILQTSCLTSSPIQFVDSATGNVTNTLNFTDAWVIEIQCTSSNVFYLICRCE